MQVRLEIQIFSKLFFVLSAEHFIGDKFNLFDMQDFLTRDFSKHS